MKQITLQLLSDLPYVILFIILVMIPFILILYICYLLTCISEFGFKETFTNCWRFKL